MGLGPMFFLNLLGGAGKRYSERKSEEREKQRRLDEMEQQHKYQLELFQEKLSAEKIQNQADKIEEESPRRLTAGEQMARQDGVTVMTENASSFSDSRRKSSAPTGRDCTTKIKDE